ncbi:MAG: amidohydrolase family protein [Gaiellales bacterium]
MVGGGAAAANLRHARPLTRRDPALAGAPQERPDPLEQAKRQQDEAYRTLAAARAAGVTLAMGHDSGPPGANLIEAVRMVDGGLSAMEGITAATANAALALGLPDVGTIRPGAAADLVVVDGDPATDIRLLTDRGRIWLVLVAGRPVAGRALAPAPIRHDP